MDYYCSFFQTNVSLIQVANTPNVLIVINSISSPPEAWHQLVTYSRQWIKQGLNCFNISCILV